MKTLKETTFRSFLEVVRLQKLINGVHYRINNQANIITFYNGSEIFMKDLFYYPSDPNFDELGSLEITFGFIDEVNQIVKRAWDISKSRTRYKLENFCPYCANLTSKEQQKKFKLKDGFNEWKCSRCGKTHRGLKSKLLGTLNPAKNWCYSGFYKPWKSGKLEHKKRFIPALVSDNPFIAASYIESLKSLEEVDKQRLLYGNWDYEDNDNALFKIDVITDLFSNKISEIKEYYISADVARFGNDLAVIAVFKGFEVIEWHISEKCKTGDISDKIEELSKTYKVARSRIVVDDGGIGGGVVDNLPGVKAFISAGKPIYRENQKERYNYVNLRAQCYFKFSELARQRAIRINTEKIYYFGQNTKYLNSSEINERLSQDLSAIIRVDIDKDQKVKIIPKDEIKLLINRSPDFSDTIMMFFLVSIYGLEDPVMSGSDDRNYTEVDNYGGNSNDIDWGSFGA